MIKGPLPPIGSLKIGEISMDAAGKKGKKEREKGKKEREKGKKEREKRKEKKREENKIHKGK